MERLLQYRIVHIVLALLTCLLLTVILSVFMPYNMDEFLHYHPLMCAWYPGNVLNTFREACGMYDLQLPFTDVAVPIRAFGYTGSALSVLYFPLFIFWPDPVSARLLGVLSVAVQAWAYARLFRLRFWPVFGFLALLYPFFVQQLVDTGPVSFQLATVPLMMLLLRWWIETAFLRYALAIAFLAFFAFWMKISYVWYFPPLLCLTLFTIWQHRCAAYRHHWKLLRQWSFAFIFLLFCLAFFLFASDPIHAGKYPILETLLDGERRPLKELFTALLDLPIAHRLGNPYEAVHRIYEPVNVSVFSWMFSLHMFVSLPVLLLVSCAVTRRIRVFAETAVYYALFVLMLIVVSSTEAAGAIHHAVHVYPFLILSYLAMFVALRSLRSGWQRSFGKRAVAVWLGLFVMLNSIAYATTPLLAVRWHDDWSKEEARELLWEVGDAHRYLFVSVDWGMYYFLGTFGPPGQSVIYLSPTTDRHYEQIRLLMQKTGRQPIFLYNQAETTMNTARAMREFNLVPCHALDPDGIWQMLVPPSSRLGYTCSSR